MTPDDFERELERRLGGIEVPEEVEQRLVEASRAWVPATARRRRRRRRAAVAVVIGLALGGGTAAAVSYLHPFGWSLSIPAGEPAAREIARSEVLSRAPWLHQSEGSPRIDEVDALPSLVFPSGTTYREALEALFASVLERGALPASARLGEPLPAGFVWDPGGAGAAPALDLRAPWGYTVRDGLIRPPAYSIPGSVPAAEARALTFAFEEGRTLGRVPRGVSVDVPLLEPCQIAGRDREPCDPE